MRLQPLDLRSLRKTKRTTDLHLYREDKSYYSPVNNEVMSSLTLIVTKQRLDAWQRTLGTVTLGVGCCVSGEGQSPVKESMPVQQRGRFYELGSGLSISCLPFQREAGSSSRASRHSFCQKAAETGKTSLC